MRIIVLIKEVPDMEKVRFDSEKGVVDRKSAGTEVNPFDLNALEAAVQMKEIADASVTALCMGPPQAEKSLKEAIARGADEGILLSDAAFGGSDTWATSITLVAAIKKMGDYDYIFAGEKTVDGDTGQVGSEVASMLKIPQICFVESLEMNKEGLTAMVAVWDGIYRKTLTGKGMLTFTKAANTPRLPGIREKMKARKMEIPVWDLRFLSEYLNETDTGFKGSPTKVKKVVVPPVLHRKGKIFREINDACLREVKGALIARGITEGVKK